MSSPLAIRIDGEEYSDWLDASFSFNMDEGASSFQISVSERWGSLFFRKFKRWQIPAGTPVEVFIHNTLVLTGFVDAHAPSLSAGDHIVSLGGRSKTGDLIDCSIVSDSYRWSGDVLGIAQSITEPFGIPVLSKVEIEPIDKFQIEAGTSCWEALKQLAKKSGVLILPRQNGCLVLDRTSDDVLPFTLQCPKGITKTEDFTGRYSDWIIQGQRHGYDDDNPLDAAQVRGGIRDTAVPRYRPKIISEEGDTKGVDAETMARWHKAVSIGQSLSATVNIPDFLNPDGDIWWPNQLIRVKSDPVGLDREMILSAVTFDVSSGGTSTSLTFKHPAAYTPEPRPKRSARLNKSRGNSGQNGRDTFGNTDQDAANVKPLDLSAQTITPDFLAF